MQYTAILLLTVFEDIEADDYKEAVQKAQFAVDKLNLDDKIPQDLDWVVESVQSDEKQTS